MTHELKSLPGVFHAVLTGDKTFEIRRNDRGFKRGDMLLLRECLASGTYSGRSLVRRVGYIFDADKVPNYGVEKGFVVMALEPAL